MAVDIAERRREHVALLESELPRIVEELKALGASLIVLFGSYAQGRRDLFTDLDIIAVMESETSFVMRQGEMYSRLRLKVEADILVYTPSEFEEMKQRPFVRHALKTGTVLYAKP